MFAKSTLRSVSSIVILLAAFVAGLCLLGNRRLTESPKTVHVPELPKDLELIESVFWEPGDTESLRDLIRTSPKLIVGKSILDIGTGSGLLALCCCQYGAGQVTATDVNPNAIQCAIRNARRMGFQLDVRRVPTGEGQDSSAFAVIQPDELFDLVISNPPWEDGKPNQWSEYALYDPEFQLLRSILEDGKSHLTPNGKILLAYGCVQAIQHIHRLAAELEYEVVVFDDRDLESLSPVFLPGMLLGLTPKKSL